MYKSVINNNFKLDRLRHIKFCTHELVCLEIEKKYLLGQLPAKYKEAKMRYKTTTTYHVNPKNEKIKYKNTAAYISVDNSKLKTKSQEDIETQLILERIYEIDTKCDSLNKLCKMYCHSINSMKLPGESIWTLEIFKSATEREIVAAKEHTYIFERARHLITREINPKNVPELSNTNHNYYVGTDNEIYRSKNEVISAMCLRNCGLSYCIEPVYPDSGKRADFGIYCSFHKSDSGKIFTFKKPKQIFIEVAGISNDEKYSATLSNKIQLAKENKIPLLIIDCTASQDNSSCQSSTKSTAHSIFDSDYLSNIFTELYFGIRKADGEFILPYTV